MQLNSFKSKESFQRSAEVPQVASRPFPGTAPAPPRDPETPVPCAHSGEEPRVPPLGLSRSESPARSHPHGRKAPSTRERSPRPTSGTSWPALLRPAGPARALTWRPGNGSSDEGPINKDWKSVRVKASRQPAAIFAIEDQSGFPPEPGEGHRCWKPREEKEPGPPGLEASASRRGRGWGWGAGWRGGAAGPRPARGKGRRADPLARVGSSAPRLPRLSRHQGRLWKQTWASPPALARSRSPLGFLPDLFPDCRGEGEGGGGGGEGVTALGRVGVAAGMGNGRRRDLWQRLRLASPGTESEGGGCGGGLREGWASEHSGGDEQERPSIQGRKGTPKVGAGLLPPAGVRNGSGAGPAELPRGPLAAGWVPTGSRGSGQHLAGVFGGYFSQAGSVPPALLWAQNPLTAWKSWGSDLTTNVGGVYICILKHHFFDSLPGGTIYLPWVPEARASGEAECQLWQRGPTPRYLSPGKTEQGKTDLARSGLRTIREGPML